MMTKTRVLGRALFGLVGYLAHVSLAYADQSGAVVSGRVVDQKSGKALAEVVVIATSNSLQGEQSVVTDSSGFYRLPNLPPGIYNLQFFHGNHNPTARDKVRLSAGTSIRLNATMLPVGSEENIIVDSPTIDSRSSSSGVNIGEEMLAKIPLIAPTGGGGAVRSFEAVATVAPGARADSFGTSLGGTTSPENSYLVNGVNTGNTATGINASPLSIEFLQEVQVLSGAYMPEFGMNTGGTISAVVRQGSNQFHGHAWVTASPGALRGAAKEVKRESSTIGAVPHLQWLGDFGADLGGPIVKDKLWFYTGVMIGHTQFNLQRRLYRFAIEESDSVMQDDMGNDVPTVVGAYELDDQGFRKKKAIPGSERTYRAAGTTIQAVARLTWSLTPDQRLDLTATALPAFTGGKNTLPANARNGTAVSPLNGSLETLGTKQSTVPIDVMFKWIADADNKRWNFETSAALHAERTRILAVDGGGPDAKSGLASRPLVQWQANNPYHSITDFERLPNSVDKNTCEVWTSPNDPLGRTVALPRCPVDLYVTGGPGFLQAQEQRSLQLRHVTTRVAQGWGHHEFKIGATYQGASFANWRGFTGGAIYRESARGTTFREVGQFGYLVGPDQPVYLSSLRWTTKLHTLRGFVQDQWHVFDKVTLNAGLLYDAQIIVGGLGDVVSVLARQFSPRVGLVWDPTQSGRAKIRAHWGRYFQAMTLQLADRSGTPNPSVSAVHTADSCQWDDLEKACRSEDSFYPGRNPIAVNQGQGTVTASSRFGRLGSSSTPIDPNLRAQMKDELAAGAEWEFIPRHAIGVDYTWSTQRRVIEDMSRDEAATYFIGNPGTGIAKDFPRAIRDYHALALSYTKKFATHWTATASYTLQFLHGNYNGLFRPETQQLDPNITSDFDLRSLLRNRVGRLDGDIRHQIKVFAGGEVPLGQHWHIDLGGTFTGSSGRPTNVLGSHPTYGANEVFILTRGAGKPLPWVFNVNLRGGASFRFTKDTSIGLAVDAFNLFNFQQVTATDQTYTRDTVRPIKGSSDLAGLEKKGMPGQDVDGNWQKATRNPNFGRPTAFQVPRQLTFSLRLTF